MDIDRVVRQFSRILRIPTNRVRLDIRSLMADGYYYDEKEKAFIKEVKRNCIGKVVPCDCGYAFEFRSRDGFRVFFSPDGARCEIGNGRVDLYNINGHNVEVFPVTST